MSQSVDHQMKWLNVALWVQEGLVYAVEFSHRSGRDLLNVAKKRTNVIPIIEDARHPHKYRMLVGKLWNEPPNVSYGAVSFWHMTVSYYDKLNLS